MFPILCSNKTEGAGRNSNSVAGRIESTTYEVAVKGGELCKMVQQDLVSTAQLAREWGCTRRNINASLKRWGVKRHAGERVSRAEAEAKRAQLSSPTQVGNSARAWKRPAPPPEQPLAGGKSKADAERIRAWIKAEGDRLALEERKKTLREPR